MGMSKDLARQNGGVEAGAFRGCYIVHIDVLSARATGNGSPTTVAR